MTDLTPERRAELRAAVTEDPSPMGSTWWPISGPSVLALLDAADERDRLAAQVERIEELATNAGYLIDGFDGLQVGAVLADDILSALDGADDE